MVSDEMGCVPVLRMLMLTNPPPTQVEATVAVIVAPHATLLLEPLLELPLLEPLEVEELPLLEPVELEAVPLVEVGVAVVVEVLLVPDDDDDDGVVVVLPPD